MQIIDVMQHQKSFTNVKYVIINLERTIDIKAPTSYFYCCWLVVLDIIITCGYYTDTTSNVGYCHWDDEESIKKKPHTFFIEYRLIQLIYLNETFKTISIYNCVFSTA